MKRFCDPTTRWKLHSITLWNTSLIYVCGGYLLNELKLKLTWPSFNPLPLWLRLKGSRNAAWGAFTAQWNEHWATPRVPGEHSRFTADLKHGFRWIRLAWFEFTNLSNRITTLGHLHQSFHREHSEIEKAVICIRSWLLDAITLGVGDGGNISNPVFGPSSQAGLQPRRQLLVVRVRPWAGQKQKLSPADLQERRREGTMYGVRRLPWTSLGPDSAALCLPLLPGRQGEGSGSSYLPLMALENLAAIYSWALKCVNKHGKVAGETMNL